MNEDIQKNELYAQTLFEQLQQQQAGFIEEKREEKLVELLKTAPFWWVVKNEEKFLLDAENGLLWEGDPSLDLTSCDDTEITKELFGMPGWTIPTVEELTCLAASDDNPLREKLSVRDKLDIIKSRLMMIAHKTSNLEGSYPWQVLEKQKCVGVFLVSTGEYVQLDVGAVIYVNRNIAQDLSQFVEWFLKHKWRMFSAKNLPDSDVMAVSKDVQEFFSKDAQFIPELYETYKNIDYNRCRLPQLESSQFFDFNKGIWELSGLDESILNAQKVRVRNPLDDIQDANIGIDFGTSSTVVAYEDINGRAKLLRVGVDDYYEDVLPEHYENPTVLEFLDFKKMLKNWTELAQQPLVSWDDVRCSHEALHNFRNNGGNPKVVASILSNLKQWALRENSDTAVRLTDQINNHEHQLEHLLLNNPVKGVELQVSEQDTFDPIELYAWFLGLNINWRGRGLFLKYYMTFPVAYPKEVKEKILSSFRRGLLRSLPAALTCQTNVMEQFTVEERASEPAAYVAAAMKAYDIEPTDDGLAYAVFDFGGGTTDFDFGYYRWATDDENDQKAIEEVFEHFEAAGDKFLGGENLLENMAYLVFRHNLDLCRENKIAFTRPLDAEDFTGSEMLVDKTQAAHTNTLMLMSRLRPFWEENRGNNKGIETMDLLNREGEKIQCELQVPFSDLSEYLDNRIKLGVESFFTAMFKAFSQDQPEEINVLLAGNSSRSERVERAFDAASNSTDNSESVYTKVFGEDGPEIIVHAPLEADINDESKPTAKTGVALGILRLCPGTEVEVINRASEISDGEAPFAYYVGRGRRGKFNVGLARNASYGEWSEIGVVPREGVFNFYYTQSNLAYGDEMELGHVELYKKSITFPISYAGQKIYASPKTPESIDIGCCEPSDALDLSSMNGLQEVQLT